MCLMFPLLLITTPLGTLRLNHTSKNIEALFEFSFAYLTDDSPLLLFVLEKKDVRVDVRTFAASYGFKLRKY